MGSLAEIFRWASLHVLALLSWRNLLAIYCFLKVDVVIG